MLNSGFDGILSFWIRVYRFVTRESDRFWVAFENLRWSSHGCDGEILRYRKARQAGMWQQF